LFGGMVLATRFLKITILNVIPAQAHWCPRTILNIVMPAEAGIQAGISTGTLEKAKHLEHQEVSH
jgi:hypothetical protein